MTFTISSFPVPTLQLLIPTSTLPFFINHPSKFSSIRVHWAKNGSRTCFSYKASLQLQDYPQKDDDPTKLLVDSIRDCLHVMEGELQVESLGEALRTIDLIERLGIHRFFERQINVILKSLYRKWNEKYGLVDADCTVLGFRLLRLHGYHVSAEVLKTSRDKIGDFLSTFPVENSNIECALLNLFKCSQIGFPHESTIMDEAENFSKAQLIKLLSLENFSQLDNKKREEIEFSLSYPRLYMLSRIEARSIVRGSWYDGQIERKCIELASIDLEMLQNVHQQEMVELERWFDEQGFGNMQIPKLRILKIYFGLAMSMFEPQFSLYRLVLSKCFVLINILDDLHDNSASYREVNLFREAFQRWDASPLENLHPHKAVFESLQRNLTEIAALVCKAQGRDLFPYIKETWEGYIAASNKDVDWKLSSYFPTFDECLATGITTLGVFASLSCTTLFLTGEQISENVNQFIKNDSRLLYLASLIGRLANDLATYKREANDGQIVHTIACYMKENLCTEEEAIKAIKKMRKDMFRELELEIFKCRGIVPEPCIRAVLSIAQQSNVTYKRADGYRLTTDTVFQELVDDYMGY